MLRLDVFKLLIAWHDNSKFRRIARGRVSDFMEQISTDSRETTRAGITVELAGDTIIDADYAIIFIIYWNNMALERCSSGVEDFEMVKTDSCMIILVCKSSI